MEEKNGKWYTFYQNYVSQEAMVCFAFPVRNLSEYKRPIC